MRHFWKIGDLSAIILTLKILVDDLIPDRYIGFVEQKKQQGLQARNKKKITAAWSMDFSGMFLSLAFFSKKVYVVISIQKSSNCISESYKCMWKG